MKDLPPCPPHDRVQKSFRRGLATYHGTATHQADIAARLALQLAQAGAPKSFAKVLEFGCGTGHLTVQLRTKFTIAALTLNDLVPECAVYAGAKDTFLPGPIEALNVPNGLDLICSASTVQWLDDIPATLDRLSQALVPGGWMALSGFGNAQFHELRVLGSEAAAPSYVDAEDWHALLPSALKIKHLSQARRVAWFPNAMHLLKHLRDTGVNGAATKAWSQSALKTFETQYRQRFGTPQGLPLTYDPVWIVAQKT
ncbi:MAG: methyltransferase domain-containing protein [Cognatishimia sp.]